MHKHSHITTREISDDDISAMLNSDKWQEGLNAGGVVALQAGVIPTDQLIKVFWKQFDLYSYIINGYRASNFFSFCVQWERAILVIPYSAWATELKKTTLFLSVEGSTDWFMLFNASF